MDFSYEELRVEVMKLLPKPYVEGTIVKEVSDGSGARYMSKRTNRYCVRVTKGEEDTVRLLYEIQRREDFERYPAVLIGAFIHDKAKYIANLVCGDTSSFNAVYCCMDKAFEDLQVHGYQLWDSQYRRYLHGEYDDVLNVPQKDFDISLSEKELASVIVKWFDVMCGRSDLFYGK